MQVRWRSTALLVAAALGTVTCFRLYNGPVRTLEPIGRCIKGAINLDNPVPFTQARFSGSVLGVAVSGGGSRAAYLSAAVLREIRSGGPELMLEGRSPTDSNLNLLDQVDVVSSVSGGSLAASYFVLNSAQLKHADVNAALWTGYLDKMGLQYRTQQWYGPSTRNGFRHRRRKHRSAA